MGQYGTVWALTLASPQEAGVQLLTHHVIITPTHTSPGDTGEALLDAECSAVMTIFRTSASRDINITFFKSIFVFLGLSSSS